MSNLRIVALLLLLPVGVSAQFAIVGSEVVPFASTSVGANFELHLTTASGEPVQPGLPVVFLLDSNEDFPLVTSISRRLVGSGELLDFLIVGVGYPEFPRYYRSRDYTPSPGTDRERPSGGADEFLLFLTAELIPWLESAHEVSSTRYVVGHSLGGLFAIHALASRPAIFSGAIASSPSVWWGQEEVINALESSSLPASMRIYTSIGSDETSLMTDSWRRLTLTIAEGEDSLRVRAQLWEGESHSSVKPFAFSRGLRWIFSPPKA